MGLLIDDPLKIWECGLVPALDKPDYQVVEDFAEGWRSVSGKATWEQVASVDAIVSEEFEQIEPDDWQ